MSLYIKIFLGIIFFLCIISIVLYTQRATENTCDTYINNQSCNKFVTKDNCGSFIDKNNCNPFIDRNNCDKFVDLPNCDKFIDRNNCDKFVDKNNCDKFVTPENCTKHINATTCDSEINQSNCDKFVTPSNCTKHINVTTCDSQITSANCLKYATPTFCASQITSTSCLSHISTANCLKYANPTFCASQITSTSCLSFYNSTNCLSHITSTNCLKYADSTFCNSQITSANCLKYADPTFCRTQINQTTCTPFYTSANCLVQKPAIIGTLTDTEITGIQTAKTIDNVTKYTQALIVKFKTDNPLITQAILDTATVDATTLNNSNVYKSELLKQYFILDKLCNNAVINPKITTKTYFFDNVYQNIVSGKNIFDILQTLLGIDMITLNLNSYIYWSWYFVAANYNDTLKTVPSTYYNLLGQKVPPISLIWYGQIGLSDTGSVLLMWFIGKYPTCVPYKSDVSYTCITDASYKYNTLQSQNVVCGSFATKEDLTNEIFKAYQNTPSYLSPNCPTNSIYRNNAPRYIAFANQDALGANTGQMTDKGFNNNIGLYHDRYMFAERACQMTPNCVGFTQEKSSSKYSTKSAVNLTANALYHSYKKPV